MSIRISLLAFLFLGIFSMTSAQTMTPLPFGAHGAVAWWQRSAWPRRLRDVVHAAGVAILALVMSWELAFHVDEFVSGRGAGAWTWATVGGVLIALTLAVLAAQRRESWPFGPQRFGYLALGGGALATATVGWLVAANLGCDGGMAPLPFFEMQEDLFGEVISLSGQDLADLVVFAHDAAEQAKLTEDQIPERYHGLIYGE